MSCQLLGLRPGRRRSDLGGGAPAHHEQPRGAAHGGRGQVHDRGGRPRRRRQDKLPGVLPPHGAQLGGRGALRGTRPPEQGSVIRRTATRQNVVFDCHRAEQ